MRLPSFMQRNKNICLLLENLSKLTVLVSHAKESESEYDTRILHNLANKNRFGMQCRELSQLIVAINVLREKNQKQHDNQSAMKH